MFRVKLTKRKIHFMANQLAFKAQLISSPVNFFSFLSFLHITFFENHKVPFVLSSLGHRQFCPYYFLWYDWSRQNQNRLMWPREDWDDIFFLLAFSWRLKHNFKRDIIDLLILCNCITNLILDRHIISILALRHVLHLRVFCLQCFVIKLHPFPVRCL